MPQKSTFFYPKLTSGLLLFPARMNEWLDLCRAARDDVARVLDELPGRAEREPIVGAGEGGDDTSGP